MSKRKFKVGLIKFYEKKLHLHYKLKNYKFRCTHKNLINSHQTYNFTLLNTFSHQFIILLRILTSDDCSSSTQYVTSCTLYNIVCNVLTTVVTVTINEFMKVGLKCINFV